MEDRKHQTIVVGLDGSKCGTKAFDYLMKDSTSTDEIHLVTVGEQVTASPIRAVDGAILDDAVLEDLEEMQETENARVKKITDYYLDRCTKANRKCVSANIFTKGYSSKRIGQSIVDYSKDVQADKIVVAAHKFGLWKRLALGSVSRYITNTATCTVVNYKEGHSPDKATSPDDVSDTRGIITIGSW